MALQPSVADSVPLQAAETKGQDPSPPAVADKVQDPSPPAVEVPQSNGWLEMAKQAIFAIGLI